MATLSSGIFLSNLQRIFWRLHNTLLHSLCGGSLRLFAFQRDHLPRSQAREPHPGSQRLRQAGEAPSRTPPWPYTNVMMVSLNESVHETKLILCHCRWTSVLPKRLDSGRRHGHSAERRNTLPRKLFLTKVMTSQQTTGHLVFSCMNSWLAGIYIWLFIMSSKREKNIDIHLIKKVLMYKPLHPDIFQPAILRPRSNEDIQHNPERYRYDWISKENHQKRCQSNQETMQVCFLLKSCIV